MLTFIQIAFGVTTTALVLVIWPQYVRERNQAARELDTMKREIERYHRHHAANDAALAKIEPELAALPAGVRTALLCAWEDGEAMMTATDVAKLKAAYERRWRRSPDKMPNWPTSSNDAMYSMQRVAVHRPHHGDD